MFFPLDSTFAYNEKPSSSLLHYSEYAQGNWALQGEAIMPVDKTALHLAVENGDIGVATQLLDAGT